MSLHLPSRRIARSAASLTSSHTLLLPRTHHRTIFNFGIRGWGFGKNQQVDPTAKPKNPITEEYLRKKPKTNPQKSLVRGDLSSSSILEDEGISGSKPTSRKSGSKTKPMPRNPESMAAALDPDPMARKRWERKMIIRGIHKRGRLTRAQVLKREERVLLSKSHDFRTSVKKLSPLARQIAGKTVEDAIIQMRFSKKQAAKEVKEHLEHAKNEAIVRRGMGLGENGGGEEFVPRKIQAKDGRTVVVRDPTRLYVDQAWVGKGLYGKSADYRARGRTHMMKNPTTSISLVLKEEKTRIRLHEEKQQKLAKRKVWMQLPNRPITAQRQYYSW